MPKYSVFIILGCYFFFLYYKMPQRKFRMILSSKNVQTTAYPRFRATTAD